MKFYRKYYRTTTLVLLMSVLATLSYVQDRLSDTLADTYCKYLAPHTETLLNEVLPEFLSANLGVLLLG